MKAYTLVEFRQFVVSTIPYYAEDLCAILNKNKIEVLNIDTPKGFNCTWVYCETKNMEALEQAKKDFKETSYEVLYRDR